MISRQLLVLSLLVGHVGFICHASQNPIDESSASLRKVLASVQTKKIDLLKQAEMSDESFKTKTAAELIDYSNRLHNAARSHDYLIKQARENIDDPNGQCNTMSFFEKRFGWGGTRDYCQSLKPSRVYMAEQKRFRERSSAVDDLASIKDNEKILNETADDIDNNKIALKTLYFGANVMPKEKFAFLQGMNEQQLRAHLKKSEDVQKKIYEELEQTATQKHLRKNEVEAFVLANVTNGLLRSEVEKEIRRKQPVAKRVQETVGGWRRWFTSPIEAEPKLFDRAKNKVKEASAWTADYFKQFPSLDCPFDPARVRGNIIPAPAIPKIESKSWRGKLITDPDFPEYYEQRNLGKPLHAGEVYNPADYPTDYFK